MFFLNFIIDWLISVFFTFLILVLGAVGVGPVSWSNDFSLLLTQEMEKVGLAAEEAYRDDKQSLDRLEDADHLKRALEDLVVLGREIKKSEERLDKELKILETKIETSLKPCCIGKFGKGFLQGYKEGIEENLPLIKEYYRIQKDLTIVMQERLLFLESVQDEFWEENGVIVFTTDEVLDMYNEFVSRVVKFAEEESLVVEKINQR